MAGEEFKKDIDLVKSKIIEQGVPVKYAKGLATLSVLYFNYMSGEPLSGFQLEKIMGNDPELVQEFEDDAGVNHSKGIHAIGAIVNAFGKKYQIFRALKDGASHGDLKWAIENIK